MSRVVAAAEVLMMDFGTMLVDFCDPISLSEYTSKKMIADPSFNPFENQAHQLALNRDLAHDLVFELQRRVRMMPTTMVASIILLYRKGISKQELSKKVEWLAMIINERGANFGNDVGLPGQNTMMIGLKHLDAYLESKGSIIEPKILPNGDHRNIIMLYYYRNPLSSIFYNEGIVLVAIHSFGLVQGWQTGVPIDQLFERACYLSDLLEREEFIEKRISKSTRPRFDEVIKFMIDKRILIQKSQDDPNLLLLRTSGESIIVFIQSLIFPMVDSYYVALIYILTFVKNKGIETANFSKNVQWLSELLHK